MKPVPERIAQAARNRVRACSGERARVMAAVQAGRPLDAEPELDRKVRRFAAVTGLHGGAAEDLARNVAPAELGLRGELRLGAERIQGRTMDFVGVKFLDLARAAARSVARVILRDGRPMGTGFMISSRLFLTNNHVISDPASAAGFLLQFNYELGVDDAPRPTTTFELRPDQFFATHPEDDLDFTIVAVGSPVNGTAGLDQFGHCPLIATQDKALLGEFVDIVQHPEGEYKQIVVRESRLVSRLDKVLHYFADTLPGASGSPVFNDQWEVVALHHWGEPHTQTAMPDGTPAGKDVNEGVRVSVIVNYLNQLRPTLNAGQQAMLDEALNAQTRNPSTSVAGTPSVAPSSSLAPAASVVSKPVSSGVGVQLIGQEAITIDPHYSNRGGYKPNFLTRAIPFPTLTTAELRNQRAKRITVAAGEDPFELRYEHFSIVMNAKRRMAFITASNIDGRRWVNINRDTGEPQESAEARETWFADPRIHIDDQCEQSLYDHQSPRTFDRGHLVRRQDPAWGFVNRAKRANADTYHFTNCSPQQWQFNEHKAWARIEDYVLDNTVEGEEKVSVFTGPVFTDDDPVYRYVRVPKRFWKIAARVNASGDLVATGFLADQAPLLGQIPERLGEAWGTLGNVEIYQARISEIENLTKFDFGPLSAADSFPGGGESLSLRRAEVVGVEETLEYGLRLLRTLDDVVLEKAGDAALT